MEDVKVIILTCEDGEWEGIYADGYLFEEGHRLDKRDWMDLINRHKHFSSVEQKYISEDDLEEIGFEFPFRLSDIPEEYIR